jgi:5,10-methylenetetrahydrofolate reductase
MEKIAEFRTPSSTRIDAVIEKISKLNDFDSLLLREEGGIDKIMLAEQLKTKWQKKIYLLLSCSDRNRIAIHSELLTAASLGLSDLVLIDGPHPKTTRFPSAKPVYDLDAFNLLRMLKQNTPAFSIAFPPLRDAAHWRVGICIGGATKPDLARAEKCLSVGADFFFVRSQEAVKLLRSVTERPVILSVQEKNVADLSSLASEAEAAGANGLNVVFDDSDSGDR